MAIGVTLTVSPSAPASGSTVTATYTVTGNTPGPGTPVTLAGDVTIGSVNYPVSATLTMGGTPALAETFSVPVCPGLTFKATAQPNVFAAVVP